MERMVENVRKIGRNPIKAIHENDNLTYMKDEKDYLSKQCEKDDFMILQESIYKIGTLLVLG